MHYRNFADTGIRVSEICLGTMQFLWTVSEENSFLILDRFLEAGGNFLDTADIYSNWVKGLKGGEAESVIGRWMKKRKNREKIFLATKVRGRMWEGKDGEGLGRAHILRACEESLKRLQTETIDLYQAHWGDESTPQEETLSAFQELRQSGKIRFIGCSNFSGRQIEEAVGIGKKVGIDYISVQPYYNWIARREFEKNVLPIVQKNKMAVIPYSPLANGFLTGKYEKGGVLPQSARTEQVTSKRMNEKTFGALEELKTMAKKHGRSVTQMALTWILNQPGITAPIAGANSIAQLDEILGASGLVLDGATILCLNQATEDFMF